MATPEVPDDSLVPSLLTLSDVMGTGWHAARAARVKAGDTVVVVGDGAVGLCGVLAAARMGAERVVAMSRHEPRQKLAVEFGATDIISERGDAARDAVLELTDGVGADAVLECVGTGQAMTTAFDVARAGATVGFVGVPHGVEVPIRTMFRRNVGLAGGVAPVRAYLPDLMADVLAGEINPGKVFDSGVAAGRSGRGLQSHARTAGDQGSAASLNSRQPRLRAVLDRASNVRALTPGWRSGSRLRNAPARSVDTRRAACPELHRQGGIVVTGGSIK